MGEIVRFKNGHARVKTRVLKTLACRKKMPLNIIVCIGMREPLACRVGVRAKNASVSGFACRPF